MRREQRDVWVADDGEIFDDESLCEAHEKNLRERQKALEAMRVVQISHSFDGTEGRGYFGTTLVVTDASETILIQWCLDKFGRPLEAWYGDGFYEAWHIHRSNEPVSWALKMKGHQPSYGHGKWSLAVVSQKDWTWAGLPASEFPWPRHKATGANQNKATGA